jgi:hypothetical protein
MNTNRCFAFCVLFVNLLTVATPEAFATPPEPVPTCTNAQECAKMKRQLAKEEAKEALLVHAREALRKLARDPRLVEVVRKATEIKADTSKTPAIDAVPGLELKDAVNDEWSSDQVYRSTIALEDDPGNVAQLDPSEVDAGQLDAERMQKASREAQRKLVTNGDSKVSYVRLALARLSRTAAVTTATAAASGKKPQVTAKRRAVARAPAANKAAVQTTAKKAELAPNCAALCANPKAPECVQKCAAWTAGHSGGR